VGKNILSQTTQLVYDGVNQAQEISGTTANRLTGLGIDEVFARTDSSGARHFLTDALASTLALLDPAGAFQTQYTYEPIGKVTVSGPSSGNPFQYTSRENDGTGLYYYRARYYSAEKGRFLSEDPLRFDGGNNFYVYVLNDPVDFTDPLGLKLCRIRLQGMGDAYIDDSIIPLVRNWIALNEAVPISVNFTEAFRLSAYQAALSSNPNVITPATPGSSLHEAGFAVDIAWSRIPKNLRPLVVSNAQRSGLNWGGEFKKPDPVHFYYDPGNRKQLIRDAQKEYTRGAQCRCSL